MELSENIKDVSAVNLVYTTPCSFEHTVLLNKTKSYSAIASCVLEHIITTENLSELEKLYYIYLDLKANYNLAKKCKRNAAIAAALSAKQLNMNTCTIFRLQTSLANKGYLNIQKSKRIYDPNVFTPTLPKSVFESLVNQASRVNPGAIKSTDCFRSYLDSDKMFIPLNYQQINYLINTKALTKLQKLIWLFFYVSSFIAKQSSAKKRATTTQAELCQTFKCSQPTISKALINLNKFGFINKVRYDVKSDINDESYSTKSVFFIEALFPLDAMTDLLAKQEDRKKTTHNIEQINHNSLQNSEAIINHNRSSNASKVFSNASQVFSNASKVFSNASHSNRNSTLKTFSNKNINNNLDVFLEKNNSEEKLSEQFEIRAEKELAKQISLSSLDVEKIWELSCNELKNIFSPKDFCMLIQPLQVKYLNDIFMIFVPNNYLYQDLIKNKDNINNIIINTSKNKIKHIKFTVGSLSEFETCQARKLKLIKQEDKLNLNNQPTKEKTFNNEKIEATNFKTVHIASLNALTNVDKQNPSETYVKKEKKDANWAFTVDIVNEKLQRNVAQLSQAQIDKATNYAKKLKQEFQNMPLLQNIDENELIKQFIHHAANFKMTKLRCSNRDDEINAALNFAWNAVKKGTWAQPADWSKAMELHLKREQLRYADDADKEIFEFELEIKKYLA